jgi:hypothetical protein
MAKFPCRVCGLEQVADMWNPRSYQICSCCMTEFGLDDETLRQVQRRRMLWLTSGADKWFREEKKPDTWTMKEMTEQLKNIPPEWWYPV